MSTGHDYVYSLSVGFGLRAGLTAGHDFRADLMPIYDIRNGLSGMLDFRDDSYKPLRLYLWTFSNLRL